MIFDISMTIHKEMMTYKNYDKNRPVLTLQRKIPEDSVNESSIFMNLHTGTHIDAAFHMEKSGATIEQTDVKRLITPCRVLDMTNVQDGIEECDLIDKDIKQGSFLLFKTSNSFSDSFSYEFIYLKYSGAKYLADMKIAGVGTDALGIERNQPGHDTHKILMRSSIIIIEGLRLKDVPAGDYLMCALPLKVKGADGAPARVILLSPESASLFLSKNV